MCLAPLILLGYMTAIQTSWHHTTHEQGAVVEVQSCETGLGADLKVSTEGYYGLGAQYGWKWTIGDWSIGALPKAGFSYVDHPEPSLPMRAQFEVGAQLLIGHGQWRAGVEYWHLSNAGLEQPNIGMDFLILQTGWAF